MLEKCYEYNVDLYHLFMDFKQAYGSVDREMLLKKMVAPDILRKMVRLTRMTLAGSECRVSFYGLLSEEFPVVNGLGQGDPL